MPYRVVIPKKVKQELAKISDPWHGRILAALAVLAHEPHRGKKLRGDHKEERSYRVWPYRILYQIRKRELVILVIRIGHRQGIY